MSMQGLKKEICTYIQLVGRIERSQFSGITLVAPSIEELCETYITTPTLIAEVLLDMNINSGVSRAKRSEETIP